MNAGFIACAGSLLTFFLCLHAAAANRVVVLKNADHPVAEEMAQELEASGFSTTIIDDAQDVDLDEIAGRNAASAAIRLNLKGNRVEVWVADRITGKMVMRTVALGAGNKPDNATIVLAAVELLRASLMEIYANAPVKGDVKATDQTRQFAKPVTPPVASDDKKITSGYFSVGAGGALPGSGAGIGGQGTVSLTMAFSHRFQFSVVGHGAIGAHTLKATGGKADIYPFLVGAQSTVLFRTEKKRVRPFAGIGLAVAVFLSKGQHDAEAEIPKATLTSEQQTAIMPAPFLTGGVLIRLTDFLTLRLASAVGISAAMARVEIAEKTVAKLGRPLLYFDAGLDITLW